MENKQDATPQRPDGERILDASLVNMDLNEFKRQLRSESSWNDSDRNSITIYKSENMCIVLIGLHKGAELKKHTANGLISVQVLDGEILFATEEKSHVLHKGQMVALHKQIPHYVKALEESFFLLTIALVE